MIFFPQFSVFIRQVGDCIHHYGITLWYSFLSSLYLLGKLVTLFIIMVLLTDQPKKKALFSWYSANKNTKTWTFAEKTPFLREISRKFSQTIFFFAITHGERVSLRDFAQLLRENSVSFQKMLTVSIFVLFDLWFYVPVNNYGHVEMVSYPNRTVSGQAS